MPPRPLILASASPRRAALLEEAGFRFEIVPSTVDEDALTPTLDSHELPAALAVAKGEDVAARSPRGVVVLAADTVVYTQVDQILGKPADRDDARRMLALLGGSIQRVVTGLCVIDNQTGVRRSGMVRSDVTMRPLSDADIDAYLATGGWRGKAGAYGIQDEPGAGDPGGPFVTNIDGELTNIVGLPMPQVVEWLAEVGVEPTGDANLSPDGP